VNIPDRPEYTEVWQIRGACPEEVPRLLEVFFAQLEPAARTQAQGATLELLAARQLSPADILGAWQGSEAIGCVLAVPAPGRVGMLWLPRVKIGLPYARPVQIALIREALRHLRLRNCQLAQAVIHPRESQAEVLRQAGLQYLTRLLFLRRALARAPAASPTADPVRTPGTSQPSHLVFLPLADVGRELFAATLLRTYEGTHDCPELGGVRHMEDILASHEAQGQFMPERWWLVTERSRPVGVLLVNAVPEWEAWEVVYMGIVPEARGHGFGTLLMVKALTEAHAAGIPYLALSVDARNHFALHIYEELGFVPWEERDIYMTLL